MIGHELIQGAAPRLNKERSEKGALVIGAIFQGLFFSLMLRTRLKNRYNRNKTADNWDTFRRQRNFCAKLSHKTKRDFYNQLDISEVTDNKKFSKTVKPFISDKCSSKSHIILIEEGETVSNESDVAEIFNKFFVTITKSLGIIENQNIILDSEDISNPIDQIIFKF